MFFTMIYYIEFNKTYSGNHKINTFIFIYKKKEIFKVHETLEIKNEIKEVCTITKI